ncbi:hypothetical protein ES332_A08G263100v1 [Gossypium tomentosum]|uniref:Uncharacterized protein n=1 Tax=Gossypium tomentosum TaxID=34277 RepID=A0A5D2PN29_GOSTO|nr:hypothetical protein ES332_A08G263100v1 [Gossypium tomentosum]
MVPEFILSICYLGALWSNGNANMKATLASVLKGLMKKDTLCCFLSRTLTGIRAGSSPIQLRELQVGGIHKVR